MEKLLKSKLWKKNQKFQNKKTRPLHSQPISGPEVLRAAEKILGLSSGNGTRLQGATIFPTDVSDVINSRHHPWLCSLRTEGFRGRHRCGVTLLSGPTIDSPDDPYVLVGTAHCNYICKDRDSGNVLETCCCRPESNPASCQKASPFCTGRPIFTLAEPSDLVISCGDFNSGVEILNLSREPEQIFTVTKIVNHPHYQPNREGIGQGGPIDGFDISVYHVQTDFKLGMVVDDIDGDGNDDSTKDYIWPICLPKNDNEFTSKRGMLAGWLDTPPIQQTASNLLGGITTGEGVLRSNFISRVTGQEMQKKCEDPQYQKNGKGAVDTFYPPGVVCSVDPSFASCGDFGSSGSGVVREWRQYDVGPGVDTGNPADDPQYQYSFVGPLSMSKGCDLTMEFVPTLPELPEFVYRGQNPLIATDATCYMSWIAAEYGLELEQQYQMKKSCFKSTGDKTDINKDVCWTQRGTRCDFTSELKQCEVFSREGIAHNVNRCVDENGFFGACNNNCKGVDPNSIIGAGVAAAAASGIAVTSLFGPALGLGVGGLAGAGGAMVLRTQCAPSQCYVRGRCCNLIINNGRPQCPRRLGC